MGSKSILPPEEAGILPICTNVGWEFFGVFFLLKIKGGLGLFPVKKLDTFNFNFLKKETTN